MSAMNTAGGHTLAEKPDIRRPITKGLLLGLAIGAAVWAVYFIKVADWLFWDQSVVPATAVVAAIAVLRGLLRDRKRFNFAVAAGVLMTVPAVILAFTIFLEATMGAVD